MCKNAQSSMGVKLSHALAPTTRQSQAEDLTGRERMVSNVIFSWGAHFVFIIAGFIMPRMIDRRLGQELLGIWDFSWSLVSYFQLVQAGIASSVNRYVARYRAAGDMLGVNRVVSSATCILFIGGCLVLGMTFALAAWLPQIFGGRLGGNAVEAQWVVFFLGISIAIHIAFAAFNGVVTGCHRWELHNLNISGWHALTVVGMIAALLLGEGLRNLALIVLMGQVLADGRLMMLAYRACSGLQVRPSLVRWATSRNVLVFGGKTLIPSVSQLLLDQTASILIVAYLGPAALALFARPRSLLHHVDTMVRKMAMVLIPTASSLQSMGNVKEIQGLLIKAVQYSCYMVLPVVAILAVYGDVIMGLWMGPDYANAVLPAILALGFLTNMAQQPLRMILAGMNAHGRAGIGELLASLCSVAATLVMLGVIHWDLVGVALAMTVPLTIMNLLYMPILVRQRVGLGVGQYLAAIGTRPLIHACPFIGSLLAARLTLPGRPLTALVIGGAIGAAILCPIYWRYALPTRVRLMILQPLSRIKGVSPVART